MKKFRIISIFILIGLLTSCGKGTSSENDSTASDTMTDDLEASELQQLPQEETRDSLPDDLDFEGVTMRIGCRNQEFSLLELTAEQTGDIVADAVYNRNLHVEERLNISLDIIPVADAPLDMAYNDVNGDATIYCVPVTVSEKVDTVGATLEALCSESHRTVVPTYFEMALKTKYASDSTTGLIVDIIKEAATTDFAYAYNYALNNAGLLCRTVMGNANGNNFASAWAKIESGAEKGLEELMKLYLNLE